MTNKWMIYGANGYTGRLVAKQAKRQGLNPVLAGRNRAEIEALAADTGLESAVFSLRDEQALVQALRGVSVVLHCAGPFSATSQPMLDACLETGAHYLDITGEISVFANAHRMSSAAEEANIVLMPGVGFDVVPTDCLAALLVKAMPEASCLRLAFEAGSQVSPGTAKTSIEGLAGGGCVRKNGELKWVPLAWKTRVVQFRHGRRLTVSVPWGDVFTAYISTGIPDIEVYVSAPPSAILRMKRLRMVKPLLSMQWVQNMMKRRIEQTIEGPDAAERSVSVAQIWGEVTAEDGRSLSATMTTPDGYSLTVSASMAIVKYLLSSEVKGGFYTPSMLMGADFVNSLPGVSMQINV
jgi:short subunit dehydrogenase-like uncharacterized protein